MTALAVNEVVCSKTSEFLNGNEDKSTETTTDSMKFAMAVGDDTMADAIEATELSNGFTDLIDEKNSKESFLSDTVHSDSTSQHGTPGTPRSEHSTPMEDVDDNCSIKLVLSDDEEDVELETAEKRTAKIDSIKSEIIEDPPENVEAANQNENVEPKNQNENVEPTNQNENVEAANQNENVEPENVDRMETDSLISMSLEDATENQELAQDNTGNSNGISIKNQDDVSVNDILFELDSCLTEENHSGLDNSNINDIEMNEASEESLASAKQNNINNAKEENHTDFQISDVLTQEEDAKSSNDSNEGDFHISIVSTQGNIQIDSFSSEEGIKINNISTGADNLLSNDSTEADIRVSNVSTEADIVINNVSSEADIEIRNVSTEGNLQMNSVSTETVMQISNSVSVGDDIKISNVSTEEDYDKEFKLSMEENFDNDKSEEENDKQETKTDEDTTDNDEIMNDENEKSEENSSQTVINLDEDINEVESDKNNDSNITNETENNAEIKEKQTEILETNSSDTECVETSTKRTSEAFKRKIDESDELDECTETKKMKTDSIKSKTEGSSKLDQDNNDTCQAELNEKDSSIKSDDDKTIEKDKKETLEKDENETIEKDENETIEKDEIKNIEKDEIETTGKDAHETIEEDENEKDENKTIEKEENKTKEIDGNKINEKDENKKIKKDDDKTIGKNKIKIVEKDENKTNTRDEKKPPETKKKLILRMLPLLFENEPIPNANVEELILTKIIEGITLRTELATLRQKAQTQEQLIDQLRRKATHLSKQLEDINTVTHRLTIDLQNKDRPVAPVKITRSVGLQVSMATPAPKRFSSSNPPNINKKRPVTNSNHHNNSSTTNNNNSSATNYNNNSSSNNNLSATNTSQSNINSNSPVKNSAPTTPAKSPSLLNKALTKPTSAQRNALVVHATPPKQQSESPAKQTKTPDNKAVTVDLTDDDSDSSKNTKNSAVPQNPPGLIPLTGNLRMVSSLGNTLSTTTTTNQPQRVTYLMATPGQNRVLIATSPATTGGVRPGLTVVGQPNVRGVQGTRYLVNTTNGQQAIVQRPGIVLTNGQTPNTVRTVPVRVNSNVTRTNALTNSRPANPTLHPAPLPILLNQPHLPNWRQIPPRPSLKISRTKDGGIQLSWSMPELDQKIHEEVASYQLYAYQEGTAPPSTDLWRKVGDVKALPLPMACTLTSFHPGNKYYFAVRAIDVHSRVSQFSYAQPISLHN